MVLGGLWEAFCRLLELLGVSWRIWDPPGDILGPLGTSWQRTGGPGWTDGIIPGPDVHRTRPEAEELCANASMRLCSIEEIALGAIFPIMYSETRRTSITLILAEFQRILLEFSNFFQSVAVATCTPAVSLAHEYVIGRRLS